MEDKDLEKAAQRLGDGAAARLDVERTARGVVDRLRTEGHRPSWWQRPQVVLRAAAAITVVVTAGVVSRQLVDTGPEDGLEVVSEAMPFQLDALSSDDLIEVLDSLSLAAPASTQRSAGLHDLSESQLQELLRRMEGE